MAWRETFLLHCGPGLLGGVSFGDWIKLLRENRFAISPSCLMRAMAISSQSIRNSMSGWYENWRYGSKIAEATVAPPVFVLGHWRSGTTHLHNLLTVDERFAFPNNFQALFPHIFLTTEKMSWRMIQFFMPRHRPMDNVEWDMRSPQEDEFALCNLTFKSPCMGWVLLKKRDHYDRYLTFRDVPQAEIEEWQRAFVWFLKKLTFKHRRPLVLKSPPHTGRIKLLLEKFPQAKFVHIHRNPYAVFQSSRKAFLVNYTWHRLQRVPQDDLDDRLIEQYWRMYDAFFEERGLIPKGNFYEIGFEELESDPMGQVRKLYEALGLPVFQECEGAMRRYVDSIAGYKKNEFPKLPEELRGRIARRWKRCFEEWGYSQ